MRSRVGSRGSPTGVSPSLWRWTPMLLTRFDPFVQDFDRAVQRAFGWADGNTFDRAVLPMDVIRRENDVLLRIDMPGVDPDSVEVTTDRNVLAVSAKRTEEFGEDEKPL